MALSLVYGNVGTSAAHSCCTGSTLQLRQASTQHTGGTVHVPGFFTKVGYDLKKNSTSWRRNRPSTVLPIRACHGELLNWISLVHGIATSPTEDLPATTHHELPNLAIALLDRESEEGCGRRDRRRQGSCFPQQVLCTVGYGEESSDLHFRTHCSREDAPVHRAGQGTRGRDHQRRLRSSVQRPGRGRRQSVPRGAAGRPAPPNGLGAPDRVDYTYEHFLADARAATEEILSKGKVPIVIGGTGMYMRWYMQNRQGITSHPYPGEDTEGLTDHLTEWDYDFQCYFLYQHRADLYPRVDIRCEQMIPELLKETSWLLDLGVRPGSNTAANAIGYDEAMQLLLEARADGGVVSKERFLSFLSDFQHNSKGLVRKQIAWFRRSERSDVRKFRWVQAGQPVEHMVELLANEYRKAPGTPPSDFSSGEILKLASLKEQKRMKNYKPEFKVYSDSEAVTSALEWIRASQASYA